MARETRIPVPDGLTTHGGVIREVILREPTFDEYLTIGEVVSIIRMPDGSSTEAEMSANINAYVAACLVQPKSVLELEQGGMWLARAVKGAVFDFFHDANTKAAASLTSGRTSSSSAATDGSAPSMSSA